MVSFSGVQDDIQDQLDSLRREIKVLRKQAGRGGERIGRQTRHTGNDVAELVREYADAALPQVRRETRKLGKSARAHPYATVTTAAVGLLAIGLAVSLLRR